MKISYLKITNVMVSWQDSSSSTADSCTIYYKYLITTVNPNISSAIANFCLTTGFYKHLSVERPES